MRTRFIVSTHATLHGYKNMGMTGYVQSAHPLHLPCRFLARLFQRYARVGLMAPFRSAAPVRQISPLFSFI